MDSFPLILVCSSLIVMSSFMDFTIRICLFLASKGFHSLPCSRLLPCSRIFPFFEHAHVGFQVPYPGPCIFSRMEDFAHPVTSTHLGTYKTFHVCQTLGARQIGLFTWCCRLKLFFTFFIYVFHGYGLQIYSVAHLQACPCTNHCGACPIFWIFHTMWRFQKTGFISHVPGRWRCYLLVIASFPLCVASSAIGRASRKFRVCQIGVVFAREAIQTWNQIPG